MWIIIRVLIAIVILFLVEFYFARKVKTTVTALFPSVPDKRRKLVIRIFLMWLNLYPVFLIAGSIYAAISGQRIYFPEYAIVDYLIIYPFWILFILIVQTIVIFLLVDIIKLLLYPIYKKYKQKLFPLQIKLQLLILAFFIIYVPARIIYDYNSITVNEIELKKKNFPDELDGFKITFISDVQADRYTDKSRLEKYINRVNQTNPELVLIAGDVITSTPQYINTAAKFIGKIESKYGIYSCIGDHDNWAYRQDTQRSVREIKSALMHYNIEMVDNDLRFVNIDSLKIGVTIITHTYVEKIQQSLLDSLSEANKSDFKIFLTHQPQNFLIDAAVKNNYDLMLAGHTHGGQLTLLFPFIQLTPTLIETIYVRGGFNIKNTLLVVTGGLGMSLAPVRYNSTPEITVIKLRKD